MTLDVAYLSKERLQVLMTKINETGHILKAYDSL